MSDRVLWLIGMSAIFLPALIAAVIVFFAIKAWESRRISARQMILRCSAASGLSMMFMAGFLGWVMFPSPLTRALVVAVAGLLAAGIQVGQLLFVQDQRHWGGRLRREFMLGSRPGEIH